MLAEKTKTPKKKIINKGNLVNDVIADIAISKYLPFIEIRRTNSFQNSNKHLKEKPFHYLIAHLRAGYPAQ